MTEPTLNEVVRRFEEATSRIAGELNELTRELREERRVNEQTYLRKDVYDARSVTQSRDVQELRGDIAEINKARESDKNWRRQVSLALAIAAGSALVSAALAVFAFVTRK